MNTNELKVGMEFTNMIKLCEYIGWKYDHKHSARLSHKLSKYILFHREKGNKIVIDEIINPNIEMVQFKPKRNGYDYNIGDIVDINNGQAEILEQTYIVTKSGSKRRAYKARCLKCGYEYIDYDYNFDKKIGCGCCNGKVVVKGINDMWTTKPELAELLLNKDDGYRYTSTSGLKTDWKCPICHTVHRNKAINNISLRGLSCLCSKTKSYPNRFMFWLLTNSGIEFFDEKTFEWSENRRYDFYIPRLNAIVEMHGSQHYRENYSFTKQHLEYHIDNDRLKRELAIHNGIEHYIEINASQSQFDYIKNNVFSSELSMLLSLNDIDWDFIKEKCEANIIYEIANCWNNGIYRAEDIGKVVGLDKSSVTKFLNKCEDFNLIDIYDKEITESVRKENSKIGIYQNQAIPIRCNENGLYFGSIQICKQKMNELTGHKFFHRNIIGTMTGEYSHHHHFTFSKITKEEFNTYKSENPDKAFGDYFVLDNQKTA